MTPKGALSKGQQRLQMTRLSRQAGLLDLTRQIPQTELSIQAVGSIPSTNDVPRLAINQTTVPRPPNVGTSAPSDDIQPAWAPRPWLT